MYVYTRDNAPHTNLSSTIDYGKAAAVQNCKDIDFSLEEVSRQQTFEHLLLDHPVTQPRQFDDEYDQFPSFENHNLPRDRYHTGQKSIVRCQQD